jgi:DNA processing protein
MSETARVVGQKFAPVDLLGPLNDIELRHAPGFLYATGNVGLLQEGRRVAVIGSREATELGLKRAARLARALVAERIIVVSGLARGIDTAAHTAAMESGGSTIAVLGTPLDKCNPPSNAKLQEKIGRDHLLVSQFAPTEPVMKHNFVLRNRTMALISNASVIVEAGEGSGSLSQGWEALRLGRPLFLLKSLIEDVALAWPKEMLNYGAMVLSSPEELLAELPPPSERIPHDAPF